MKPRGRAGPNVRSSDQTSETSTQLLTALLPLVTALTQRQGEICPPVTPTHKRTRDESVTPSGHVSRRSRVVLSSSPAPAVEDELQLCLDAFGKAKSISADAVNMAFDGLDSKGYTPDTLEMISIDRIAELTGLAEGKAAALMKFAREWSFRVEQKRARAF